MSYFPLSHKRSRSMYYALIGGLGGSNGTALSAFASGFTRWRSSIGPSSRPTTNGTRPYSCFSY